MLTEPDITLRRILLIGEIARYEKQSSKRAIRKARDLLKKGLSATYNGLVDEVVKLPEHKITQVIHKAALWGEGTNGDLLFTPIKNQLTPTQ